MKTWRKKRKEKTRRGRGEGRNFSFRHFSHVNFHDVKHSPTHSSMTRNPRRVSMYLEEVSVAARPALSATRKAFRYLARQQFCALICGVETAPTGVLHNNFLPWHDVCTVPTIPTILLQKQLHSRVSLVVIFCIPLALLLPVNYSWPNLNGAQMMLIKLSRFDERRSEEQRRRGRGSSCRDGARLRFLSSFSALCRF